MINITKSDFPPLEDYIKYLEKIWENNWLTNNGEAVQSLEKRLEDYLGVKNLLVVANGSLALQLALKALDLKGEVITTPFTFSATAGSINWLGLETVFADIDPETFNLDPNKLEVRITKKTSAILPVHVYGNPCNVEKIQEIANKNKLKVIYDAAHSFGVEYEGKSVLSFGDISVLSFHATKVFNTAEGGALIIRDRDLYERIKLMRDNGIRDKDEVDYLGTNAKMSEFHAALGICNLDYIDENLNKRRFLYNKYQSRLGKLKGLRFQKFNCSRYNYSYFPVLLGESFDREKVIIRLRKQGINPRKYFYPLLSDLPFFNNVDRFPVAEDISRKVVCLPIYPDMPEEVIGKVFDILKGYDGQ